jgi:hypothetical protein
VGKLRCKLSGDYQLEDVTQLAEHAYIGTGSWHKRVAAEVDGLALRELCYVQTVQSVIAGAVGLHYVEVAVSGRTSAGLSLLQSTQFVEVGIAV